MKRQISPFGNGHVRLRLVEEADLDATLSWRNRDDARIWFKSAAIIDPDQHRSWYECYKEKDDDFLFVIETADKLVGQASVYGINWAEGTAEVGRFLVAPEDAGKGYISEACEQLVWLCHNRLGLSYIFLEVFDTNDRAINIYNRNGFFEESRCNGLMRMGLNLIGKSDNGD